MGAVSGLMIPPLSRLRRGGEATGEVAPAACSAVCRGLDEEDEEDEEEEDEEEEDEEEECDAAEEAWGRGLDAPPAPPLPPPAAELPPAAGEAAVAAAVAAAAASAIAAAAAAASVEGLPARRRPTVVFLRSRQHCTAAIVSTVSLRGR